MWYQEKKKKTVLQMYLITKNGYIKKHFARCHHIFMNAEQWQWFKTFSYISLLIIILKL